MQLNTTMTSLWRNVSVNVVARLFINFCSQSPLKSATDCCQMERQIQQDVWDDALHMYLNNASMRTDRKCLKRNNGHLITLQFEWNWDIVSGKQSTKQFWNLHPKPRTWDIFRRSSCPEFYKSTWTVTEYILTIYLYWKKCFHLRRLRYLEQFRQFW